MGLETFDDLVQAVLARAGEIDPGGTASDSPFYGLMDELVAEAHRDLITRHPWLDLVSDPIGVLLTTDDITTLTLTIAAAGTSVAATLSAVQTTDLTGRKIRPAGKNWIARISAHTPPSASVTLDAAPETIAAGTACVIFQDEYTLASDLGLFVDGLWDQAGDFVPLVSYERLVSGYPNPPEGARTADAFARLTRRKIRLSHYPNTIRRYEYPYIAEISDPTGSSTLTLPAYLRPVLANGVLALLYERKQDARETRAQQRFEIGIERAIAYETKRRVGFGVRSAPARQGGYADRR